MGKLITLPGGRGWFYEQWMWATADREKVNNLACPECKCMVGHEPDCPRNPWNEQSDHGVAQ